MLQFEVFVSELLAVNALAARAVEPREISALDHEVFYDAMKYAAAVAARALSLLSGGHSAAHPKPFSPVQSARKFSAVYGCRTRMRRNSRIARV